METDAEELRRWLYRDYVTLGRYGHQPISQVRELPHAERRALVDAIMELIDEENEAQQAALRERD